jgi:hypothetical protein
MTDLRNFLLNTNYPLDKVLKLMSDSFTVDARYSASEARRTVKSTAHGLGDYCLIAGIYSYDNTEWFPLGVNKVIISGSPIFDTVAVSAYSTDTDVVVVASNNMASSYTIYYKLELMAMS